MFDLRSELNSSQYAAASQLDGPVLVLAGAGSGKTRMLTYRIANLISHGIPADQILAVTFTNKAAGEMKERIAKILGTEDTGVTACTFHSFGARMLSRNWKAAGFSARPSVCDEDDRKKILKDLLKDIGGDPSAWKIFSGFISSAKDLLLLPWTPFREDDPRKLWSDNAKKLYWEYQKKLKKSCLMDFDDLITLTTVMLRDNPKLLDKIQDRFRYLLVDEYQDTSHAQYVLTRLLADKYKNICVVGDDYQSIYAFRGADMTNILNFEKDYPNAKTFAMGENYRSTPPIVNAAQAVIRNNTNQRDKDLQSMNPGDAPLIKVRELNNAPEESGYITDGIKHFKEKGIPLDDIAVLYRANWLSRNVEESLIRAGIPYVIYGGVGFYQRKEIRDCLAFLKAASGMQDRVSFLRVINTPARGMGGKSVDELEYFLDTWEENLIEGTLAWTGNKRPKLRDYCEKLQKAAGMMADGAKMGDALEWLLMSEEGIGYGASLVSEKDDENKSTDRLNNIYELIGHMRQWQDASPDAEDPAADFLEEVSLYTDADMKDKKNKVQLMTMHRSKGLEFEAVFLMGMDQQLIPGLDFYPESADDLPPGCGEDLEEERRLCYVGMTRAKKHLILTHAQMRMKFGQTVFMTPSQFIDEIPDTLKDNNL